ncbi:GerAB/ArcD/ProY family transporter [Paenibacillus sp. 481]|uniref:GerAB/ArcD/ProY family transporter n=1 Tax=Paenibacillus sp. 481 TaxID=2835869 RepID=UPI001E506C37|nr:GerAB/ArcD/ProY family transporter [Paenibacillus sp. 481]UHA75732.1 GerAB/ArcD/ProY family transporter [Paenibacillus sp. 481]
MNLVDSGTKHNKINTPQMSIILANNILGTAILSLPRNMSMSMDTPDGWISIFLTGLICIGIGYLMVYISNKFPGLTVFEYSQLLIGKWLGRILVGFMIVFFIGMASYEVRVLAEVVDLFLLEQTPKSVIIIVMMMAAVYIVFGELGAIARLFGILLPITVLVLFGCLLLSLKTFDIEHLRPALSHGIIPIVAGFDPAFTSFIGIEALLILPAFLTNPSRAPRAVWYGIGVPTAIYFFTYLAVIGGLGVEVTKTVLWPTISLIRSFEYTGLLFERFDSFLMAVWIMQIYTAYVMYHYFIVRALKVYIAKPLGGVFLIMPIIYLLAMIPRSVFSLFKLLRYIEWMFYGIVIVVPLLLIFMYWIRGKANHEAQS